MTQINLFVNSMPRDLAEFLFFLIVGFTAGNLGIVLVKSLILFQIVKYFCLMKYRNFRK